MDNEFYNNFNNQNQPHNEPNNYHSPDQRQPNYGPSGYSRLSQPPFERGPSPNYGFEQPAPHENSGYESRNIYNRINASSNGKMKKKRILAHLIDMALINIINAMLMYLFIYSNIDKISETFTLYGQSAALKQWLGSILITLFLSVFFFMLNSVILPAFALQGQSIGKKIMKIRVLKNADESRTPSFGTFLLRETIGKMITFTLFIGVVLFLLSKDDYALHDKIFRTIVIDDGY